MIGQVKKFLGIERQSAARSSRKAMSWVIPAKLAVGGFPKPGDGGELLQSNIKVVLSVCAESEGTLPKDITEKFKCLRLVLPDRFYTTELTAELLAQAVEIVREQIENDLPIFIHCLAGVERSPTVAIAYLCRYQKLELWEAMNWVKSVHPSSMPSTSEIRAMRDYIALGNEENF
jgi:atypical dual specificity phosphatase